MCAKGLFQNFLLYIKQKKYCHFMCRVCIHSRQLFALEFFLIVQ